MLMFSRRLRASRVAIGFDTPEDFARVALIEERRYEKIEAGKQMPDPDELTVIARLTGRTLDFLIAGTPTPPPQLAPAGAGAKRAKA